jgi:hypothetical protein
MKLISYLEIEKKRDNVGEVKNKKRLSRRTKKTFKKKIHYNQSLKLIRN